VTDGAPRSMGLMTGVVHLCVPGYGTRIGMLLGESRGGALERVTGRETRKRVLRDLAASVIQIW
jgi:hypothetical protein